MVDLRPVALGADPADSVRFADHRLAAAVPAVGTNAAAPGAVRRADQLQAVTVAVIAIEVGVFVDAVVFIFGGNHHQLVTRIIGTVDVPAAHRDEHLAVSGHKVYLHQLLLEALHAGKFAAKVDQFVAVLRQGVAFQQIQRTGQRFHAAVAGIKQVQTISVFIGDAAAVAPEGQLGKHLIILFLLAICQHLGACCTVHLHKVFPEMIVIVCTDQIFALAQLFDGRYCRRHRHLFLCFSAAQRDGIVVGIGAVHLFLLAVSF